MAKSTIENIISEILTESGSKWGHGGEYRKLQDKFGTMRMSDITPIINANTK